MNLHETVKPSSLSRREWMLRLLETSLLASAAPATGLAQNGAAGKPAAAWGPQFLNAQQNEVLVALGERIVPGSAGAQCNRLIDLILSLESAKPREDMAAALAAFDRDAHTRYGKRYAELPAAQQDAILTAASAGGPLRQGFQLVKEWIADAYWSSEPGMRERGWTGRMAWESYDACK